MQGWVARSHTQRFCRIPTEASDGVEIQVPTMTRSPCRRGFRPLPLLSAQNKTRRDVAKKLANLLLKSFLKHGTEAIPFSSRTFSETVPFTAIDEF